MERGYVPGPRCWLLGARGCPLRRAAGCRATRAAWCGEKKLFMKNTVVKPRGSAGRMKGRRERDSDPVLPARLLRLAN